MSRILSRHLTKLTQSSLSYSTNGARVALSALASHLAQPQHARHYSAAKAPIASNIPPSPNPFHRTIMSLESDTLRLKYQYNTFIHPTASLIGSVWVNDHSVVLSNSVLRGDLSHVYLGAHVTIEENCTITSAPGQDCNVYDYTIVGPGTVINAAEINPRCRIGANVVIQEGAVVETKCMIEDGSVVLQGELIHTGELWAGNPARKVRDLTYDEMFFLERDASFHSEKFKDHAFEFLPYGNVYLEMEKLQERGQWPPK